VALLRKMTCNLRHPMGLRHPVLNVRSTVFILANTAICIDSSIGQPWPWQWDVLMTFTTVGDVVKARKKNLVDNHTRVSIYSCVYMSEYQPYTSIQICNVCLPTHVCASLPTVSKTLDATSRCVSSRLLPLFSKRKVIYLLFYLLSDFSKRKVIYLLFGCNGLGNFFSSLTMMWMPRLVLVVTVLPVAVCPWTVTVTPHHDAMRCLVVGVCLRRVHSITRATMPHQHTWHELHDATGWRRPIGCLNLQVNNNFKRATNYRALLRKISWKDKASYGSLPPCTWGILLLAHVSGFSIG